MFLRYHTLTDEKLMSRIQRGSTAAFDELYARYSKRMLYYFHRMLGRDEEKAQDFLQDLFLKIVEDPARFKRGSCFCFLALYGCTQYVQERVSQAECAQDCG